MQRLKYKLKNKLNKLKSKICTDIFIADFLFILGLFILIITTFLLNAFIAAYMLSAVLIALSIYIARTKKGGKSK